MEAVVEEYKKVDHRLMELHRYAMRRYIQKKGIDWIWDLVDKTLEQEILKELTPDETTLYRKLLERWDELFSKIHKRR